MTERNQPQPARDSVVRPTTLASYGTRGARTHRFTPEELRRYEQAKAPTPVMPEPVKSGERNRGGRRTVADMLSTMPTAIEKADYALGRIRRLEDQISQLLSAIGPDAATLVINERPSLRQYFRS
jgi:hypothetical protein